MLNNQKVTRKLASIAGLTLCLLILPGMLHSQTRINSPYSMLGPGEIKGNDYFRNLGMGGISQGFRSNLSINYLNPASYTALDSLSFVFDGTVFSHIYQQKKDDLVQTSLYTNLGNLTFAFPVTRRWSFAAGLLPYSLTGYKITSSYEDDQSGRVNFQYEGSGGINQVFVGNAFRLFRGLSAGINVSYLFGRTEDRMISYSDTIGFYSTTWSYSNQTSGLMLSYGLQWQIPFSATSNLTLGASYSGLTNIDLNQNSYIYRTLNVANTLDTLSRTTDRKGIMEIPSNIAAGAFMTFNPTWSAGIDFQTQAWSKYETFDQQHNLNDSYQLRLGTVYTPRVETYSGILNRVEYRAGLRYGKSFLKLTDASGAAHDFNELGISFGMAIPVRRSLSALNLGFEFSQRKSQSESALSENFFRFNIGVNIYERWFVKRKFY